MVEADKAARAKAEMACARAEWETRKKEIKGGLGLGLESKIHQRASRWAAFADGAQQSSPPCRAAGQRLLTIKTWGLNSPKRGRMKSTSRALELKGAHQILRRLATKKWLLEPRLD